MSGPRVSITQGLLEGRHDVSDKGMQYACFQGIPYGKPPLGELRFKDPIAAEGWEGVHYATKDGSVAPQYDITQNGLYVGDENCLFLNVFTTQPSKPEAKLPVMVHVHGGAFVRGSGSTSIHGPEYLLEKDVVLVTFNYRLSVLGFLCLHTPDVPGNAALKDQILALKWVRDNIEHFGGNPGNITLLGESAGAAFVQLLTMAPMARGLFHKALLISGSTLSSWAFQADPLNYAYKFAKSLGCQTSDKNEIVKFLQTIPTEDLIKCATNILDKEDGKKFIPSAFLAVIEQTHDNVECMIGEDPRLALERGEVPKVPYMIGYSAKDSLFLFAIINYDAERISELIEDFQYFVPLELKLNKDSAESIAVAEKIKRFYFGDKPVGRESVEEAAELLSDFVFRRGIHETIQLISDFSDYPIYHYQFTYFGNLNAYKEHSKKMSLNAAAHAEENGYIFKTDVLKNEKLFPEDEIMREQLVQMWTNFAKFGNPTPEKTDLITTIWEPVKKNKHNYLDIDRKLVLRLNPNAKSKEFWIRLINDN